MLFLPLVPEFPVGAFPMPEFCRRLTEATGVTHGVDGRLRDYPVFVSIHGGDPKRIETLLATALGGEWQRDGKTLVLTPIRPKVGEGAAEFERQFRLAAKGWSYLPALPLADLYAMPPGAQVRFGSLSGPLFRPFAKGFAKEGRIMVRRDAYGSFSFREDFADRQSGVFTPGGQLQFASLPPAVAAKLGDDAKKPGMTKEESAAAFKGVNEPATLKIDWKALDRADPIGMVNAPILKAIAAKIAPDLVVALPDMTLMNLPHAGSGATVEAALGAYAATVEWHVEDGAVIGSVPECERLSSSQARRAVLSGFVQTALRRGIPTPGDLSTYLANQRPGASETWGDVMLIVMGGVVIDESNIGDHPFNLRFEGSLSGEDWRLIETGRRFSASSLSPAARGALRALLLDARTRLESGKPDPATWPSLRLDRLTIKPELIDEEVVIAYGGFVADVDTPRNALAKLPQLKEGLGREPLYQPAHRRRLKFRIASLDGTESVETGFGEITPVPGSRLCAWTDLPESIRKVAAPMDAPSPVRVPLR